MRLSAFSLLSPMLLAAPLTAQVEAFGRVDVVASSRYVWHGLTRAAGAVLQPSTAAGVRWRRLALEAGTTLHLELDRASAGEISETGLGRGLGESDTWLRGVLDGGAIRLHLGVMHYDFRGDDNLGGIGPSANTTEVYSGFSLPRTYLTPLIEVWSDVGKVRGSFVRASGSVPLLGWPFLPSFFVHFDGDLGLNLGQGRDPLRPGDRANYFDNGITHLGLGLTGSMKMGPWAGLGFYNLSLGLRSQLNIDDATRFNGSGRASDASLWFWLSGTIAIGGEARRLP